MSGRRAWLAKPLAICRIFVAALFIVMLTIPTEALATDEMSSQVGQQAAAETSEATVQEPVKPVEPPVVLPAETPAPQSDATPTQVKNAPLTAPQAAPTPVVTVTQPPQDFPPKTPLIISAFQSTNALGFVELYNSGASAITTSGWRLEADFGTAGSCTIMLHDVILAKQQVLLVRSGTMTTQHARPLDCGSSQRVLKTLTVYNAHGEIVETFSPPIGDNDPQVWQRKNLTATYMKGNFANDFKELARPVVDGEWYTVPPAPTLEVREVVVNPRSCVVPDDAIECGDYVKVVNVGSAEVDLADYRLRSGYSNAAVSSSNMAYITGKIAQGEMKIIRETDEHDPLSLSANDGTVWFEDSEGIATFDMHVPPYVDSGLTSKKGMSWALDASDTTWKWGIPSPDTLENRFPVVTQGGGALGGDSLKPCAANQYRSPETNRCRLIATIGSTLTPCREGQYRSEETNRCRSIASAAAAVLKPCADNQFRNPATNRCRSIASVDDVALADCGEGRERNPETNRCRNVVAKSVPAAAFPVEQVKETGKAFIGWWALGGVGVIAVGYAAWEWRKEIVGSIRKVGSFFTAKK